MSDAGRWVPLRYYLRVQRTRGAEITMTFRQIEGVLGDGLPKPARKYPEWWANDATSEQAHAWLDVGWRVASCDLAAESVAFVRDEPPG